MLDKGYKMGDLHVHSSASADVLPTEITSPKAIIKKQKDNYLIPVLTDHDTMDGFYSLNDPFVVPGAEIKLVPRGATHTLHMNVYDLNKEQFSDLEQIAGTGDLDAFVDYANQQDLPFQYNHPYWHGFGEKLDKNLVAKIAKKFPVIEMNSSRIKRLNDAAYNIARDLGKGVTSSSDSHIARFSAFTLARGADFREYWDNIKNGNSYFVRSDLTMKKVFHEVDTRVKQVIQMGVSNNFSLESFGISREKSKYVDCFINSKPSFFKKAFSYFVGYGAGMPIAALATITSQKGMISRG